jgi:hypothetical protein
MPRSCFWSDPGLLSSIQIWNNYLGPGVFPWSQIVAPGLKQLWPGSRPCRRSRSGTTTGGRRCPKVEKRQFLSLNMYWASTMALRGWGPFNRLPPLSLIQIWNNYRGSSSSKSRKTAIFESKYVLGVNYGSPRACC